jgi:hypothetical protein
MVDMSDDIYVSCSSWGFFLGVVGALALAFLLTFEIPFTSCDRFYGCYDWHR